jgi:small subunit ribosomal protein S13
MPRILNFQVPDKKRVPIALTTIKGIGLSRALFVCKELSIKESVYMKELTKNQLKRITLYIKKHFITGQKIDTEQLLNIRTLIKISSYKGFRHARALPVNGQRTRSNSKTARKLNRKK